MTAETYRQLVKDIVLDEKRFVRAVLSGRRRGCTVPWKKVVVRPVLVKDVRHLQFSYLDEKQDITKNYLGPKAAVKLDELLELGFRNVYVQATEHEIHVQITKKGKAIIHRQERSGQAIAPSLQHDRRKDLLLPVGQPDPFLQAIGIMTQEGKVRARMRKKFRQINEFLKLVLETGVASLPRSRVDQGSADGLRPLCIVDCGCGNAYLAFAVYHYFNHVLGVPTQLVGIDVNEALIKRRAEQVRDLGWQDLSFQAIRIADFRPDYVPDVVLALHACDTATDEALAQAVKWRSRMVFAAPCCHHHLQQQLACQPAPPSLRAVYRHGILCKRLGDVLTDALRALLLRIMGYDAEVIQFVSAEHTDKNLMIRAVRSGEPGDPRALREYRDLTGSFGVTPYLAVLLEQDLALLSQVVGERTDLWIPAGCRKEL